MMVMPADATGFLIGWLAATYPGRFGWLLNATCWRQNPRVEMPWAMDNGKFGCWTTGREWDESGFFAKAETLWHPKPMWVVVPDVVADRDGTLREWDRHAPRLLAAGHTLAMAVQDGMTPDDLPDEAAVVFVGGTTEWKWRSLPMWASAGRRLHVGRCNSGRMLRMAFDIGAESIDGTGWMRRIKSDPRRLGELTRFLDESANPLGRRQQEMDFNRAGAQHE